MKPASGVRPYKLSEAEREKIRKYKAKWSRKRDPEMHAYRPKLFKSDNLRRVQLSNTEVGWLVAVLERLER